MPDPIFSGEHLLIATGNPGKFREISDYLHDLTLETHSLAEFDLPSPPETGDTYADNAIIKARAAAEGANMMALADDSGFEIMALDGLPGVDTRPFMEEFGGYDDAANALDQRLGNDRSARFICVMALACPDGSVVTTRGQITGHFIYPGQAEGDEGFGFDPYFVPDGADHSFAYKNVKANAVDHRQAAIEKMIADHLSVQTVRQAG
jgi:XTP/dITP diphosphohydrolase